MDIAELELDCEMIFKLRAAKKEIEEKLTEVEKRIKDHLVSENKVDEAAGRFLIHLKKTPETMIVDTAKLKADGLFDRYSKVRAGSTSLMVTESEQNQ